jgi:acyl-CoA synthetase (AMP-forming)/AMP-acid ligase II
VADWRRRSGHLLKGEGWVGAQAGETVETGATRCGWGWRTAGVSGDSEEDDRGNLKALICGSAPLSAETQLYFMMLGIRVLQVYGLTETTAICTMDDPNRVEVGYVGPAIPGMEMKLGRMMRSWCAVRIFSEDIGTDPSKQRMRCAMDGSIPAIRAK